MPLRPLLTLVAATLPCAFATTTGAAAQPPMVLLLDGGGWTSSDPASMIPYAEDFEAHGYRTRIVAYPLGSVTASIDYVDAVAQEEADGR